MTRAARRLLHTTGTVSIAVPNLKRLAVEKTKKLWSHSRGRQTVVWLDNWYRKRFGSDPELNNMTLNVSVFAVLHITDILWFGGHLTLRQVIEGIARNAAELVVAQTRLASNAKQIADQNIEAACIRVPLDVPREGVRALQWLPFKLAREKVGNNKDLLVLIDSLSAFRVHSTKCLPQLQIVRPSHDIQTIQHFLLIPSHVGVGDWQTRVWVLWHV
jgi:hypothetical protein